MHIQGSNPKSVMYCNKTCNLCLNNIKTLELCERKILCMDTKNMWIVRGEKEQTQK